MNPETTKAIESAVSAIAPQRDSILAKLGKAETARVDCYRELVLLIDQHREAFADSDTNRLHPGALDSFIGASGSCVDRSILSSAWGALNADREAFMAANACRRFAEIVRASKSLGTSAAAPDRVKALKAFTSALNKALQAGIDVRAIVASVASPSATVSSPKPQPQPQPQPQPVTVSADAPTETAEVL